MFRLKSTTEKTDGRLDIAQRVLNLNTYQQKLSKLKHRKSEILKNSIQRHVKQL